MTKLKGKARAKASKKKKNKQKNDYFLRKKYLISEIRKYDDEVLAVECEVVSNKEDIKRTIGKMMSVLNATENGVGLAASQIGVLKKIVIIKLDSDSKDITVMINPEIISKSEEMKFGKEGCLSYPGIYGFVERYTWVEVKYLDMERKEQTKKYKESDILGIVVQHEISHLLNGHCQIYDWWKDPEGKQKELTDRFALEEAEKLEAEKAEETTGGYEVVESEDKKKEDEKEDVDVSKQRDTDNS